MEVRKHGCSKLEKSAKKPKVAVLMGGIGSEREVSIQSGSSVADALRQADFEIVTADLNPDNLEILEDKSIDVFFPVLHGEFGEDGTLQQILEDKSLPYIGSGPAASRAAFDKLESKKLFSNAGVPVPNVIEFDNKTDPSNLKNRLQNFSDKFVIKPVRQGSSVGICIVSSIEDAIEAAEKTLSEFGDCMIEEFIPGKELTLGILGGEALPIIEIRPKTGFYNYHAKYIDDHTQYLFDTIQDLTVAAKINRQAIDCFDALGCRHFARIDFILNEKNIPFVLEANTIPGFTSHSLLPKAAAKAGLSMSELCKKIVETVLISRDKNSSVFSVQSSVLKSASRVTQNSERIELR
jgi:D-alanine-D-alanine ligase